MYINGKLCAYRDYHDYIIVFSNETKAHFILQDIYAEFFRALFIRKLDEVLTIHMIAKDYDVSEEMVGEDLAAFLRELDLSCALLEDNTKAPSPVPEMTDRNIYSLMSEKLIPFSATIEIIDECNLDCIHCYRDIPSVSYWDTDSFEKALLELKSLGTLHLTLTGGEPLLHKNFEEFLDIIKIHDFVLTIQSNATCHMSEIVDKLLDIPIKSIAVSLYSTLSETHDCITRKAGSCEKTIESIYRMAQHGLPVSINCPVMSVNKEDMELVQAFANQLGIPCNFSFKIIPSQREDKSVQQLNCFSTDFLYEKMVDLRVSLYQNILPNIRKSRPSDRYCETGFRSITFDAQGKVLLCNAFRKECGDLRYDNIENIWKKSQELVEWRELTSLINEKCKSCEAFSYCEPCPAHEYTLTRDERAIDELTCSFGKAFYNADHKILFDEGRKE